MRKPANPITDEILRYFVYDETSSSCLRWKFTRYANIGGGTGQRVVVYEGDVAGHLRKDGYWTVKLFAQSIKIHRIIYCMFNGLDEFCDIIIDHKNGDSSDNRLINLVPSNDFLNGKNKSKYRNNSTGTTGVHLNEKSSGKFYYVATWRNADKSIGAKSFSIDKLGKEEAYRQACEYRENKIKCLKEQGVPYSERHGL